MTDEPNLNPQEDEICNECGGHVPYHRATCVVFSLPDGAASPVVQSEPKILFDALRIQVVRQDGDAELLTLVPPIVITKQCITSGTGMQHFFTPEGLYDGWGMPFSAEVTEGEVMEQIAPAIQAIEDGREILPRGEE